MRHWGKADVDGSSRSWTEVALQTVNGNSLASCPSPLSKNLNQFRWSSEIHAEKNKMFVGFDKDNNHKLQFRISKNATWTEEPKCPHLGDRSVQNADCRLQTGYQMQTRYKMQTADWVQNADWECILFSWSSTFRGIHTLICAYVPYIVIGLHEEPPHKHTHTHTNKKDTACLITSAHSTSSQHNLFSNSHHDECISFPNTQLRKNKIKFNPKVLKVHIKRI